MREKTFTTSMRIYAREKEKTGIKNLKIKFNEYKDEKHELTQEICQTCDATLVRIIGNVAILYKQAENPDNRIIKLD